MKNTDIERQIQAHVDDFVADLTELIHEAALAAVGDVLADAGLGSATPSGRTTKKKRTTKRRSTKKRAAKRSSKKRASKKRSTKKRGRRGSGPSEATLGKVTKFVKANPGLSVSEIAKGASSQLPATKKAVAQLLEDGVLRKEGERRGTKYFAK